MQSAGEDVKDIEQIFGKFFFWRVCRLVENHEFSTSSFDKMFNEVNSESCQSVSVGNHKFDAISSQRSFQNG